MNRPPALKVRYDRDTDMFELLRSEDGRTDWQTLEVHKRRATAIEALSEELDRINAERAGHLT